MLSDFTIVFRRVMGFAPFWMIEYFHLLPKKDIQVLTSCKAAAHKIGVDLLTQEKKAYRAGKEGGTDIMSTFGQWVRPLPASFCQLTLLSISQGQFI
jgi:hypothetical protein